jgi:hypothetical protein
MASTNVAYLKMKMSAPSGVISVVGNYKISLETASARSCLAESLVTAEQKKRLQTGVVQAQSAYLGMAGISNPLGGTTFKPPK